MIECAICGKESEKEYCSKHCYKLWLKTNYKTGKMNQQENFKIKNCLQCNSVFLSYLNKSKFCQNICFKRFIRVPERRMSLQSDESQIYYLIKKIKTKYKKEKNNG